MAVDKLNVVSETKVLTIEQYFNEMPITDRQKKNRIDLCDDLEMFFAYLLEVKEDFMTIPIDILVSRVQTGMLEVVGNHLEITDNILERINEDALYIVETTVKNIDTPFFTSLDRARLLAENETQSIYNLSEYDNAVSNGYAYKEWLAILDEKTRPTHAFADGQRVPIGTPFIVGSSLMMFPTDTSLGATPEEIINCRCVMIYTR